MTGEGGLDLVVWVSVRDMSLGANSRGSILLLFALCGQMMHSGMLPCLHWDRHLATVGL